MRSLFLVFILVAVTFCFLGAISHGLQVQNGAFLDSAFTQYENSIKADAQTQLAALGQAKNVTSATLAALATPQPMDLCQTGATGCTLQATATISAVGASNGYHIGSATATNANSNVNTALNEIDVDVVWTLTITSNGQTVSSETARQSYAVSDAAPFAVPEGNASSQVRGALGGGAKAQNYAGGCNASTGSGCAPYTSTTSENSTTLQVAPTCAPNEDATECSSAGSYVPTDSYTSKTWNTTPN